MIILAGIATVVAMLWTFFVIYANGMADTGRFDGVGTILMVWFIAIAVWTVWWIR